MGRQKGSKNKDFDKTRKALLTLMAESVLKHPTRDWSFRELSKAAGVSVPTLRHYFSDQSHALSEVFAEYRKLGEPHLHHASTFAPPDLEESLAQFLTQFRLGWNEGVSSIHAVGLVRGIGDEGLGPSYVNDVLEPTIQALETRLAIHVVQGIFPASADRRVAAIELLAPLFLVLLHQDTLFGRRCRPLDLDAFTREHLHRFLRAWRT